MTLPVVVAPKGRLTERELRAAAASSHRLRQLRDLPTEQGGCLTIKGKSGGHANINLTSVDTEALIALLVERDTLFLTSFDIELDPA